jgi:hypothetical protein
VSSTPGLLHDWEVLLGILQEDRSMQVTTLSLMFPEINVCCA